MPRSGRHAARGPRGRSSRAVAAVGLVLATGAAGAAAVRVASSAEAGSSAAGPGVLATDQRAAQGPRPVSPSVSAAPRYLTSTYHAPRHLIDVGGGGTLQIPSIGVTAPVDSVGLDGTTMALPDDPARVGWLDTTAPAGGPDGSSVLAGHVSDEHDDPGALWSLRDITVGAHAIWTDAAGVPHVFVVTAMAHYPRATGLPAATFGATGPHVLRLVTCADRLTTAGGGFHYADNLVVTAVEASARTG